MIRRIAPIAVLFLVLAGCAAPGSDGAADATPDESTTIPATGGEPTTTAEPDDGTHTDEDGHTEDAEAHMDGVADDSHTDDGAHMDDGHAEDAEAHMDGIADDSHADDGAHMDNDGHMDDGHMEEAAGNHGEFIPGVAGVPTSEIDVVLTDFAFEPETVSVAPGETVRFHFDNQGVLEHEFRLSSEHKIEEHLAAGHESGGHHDGDPDIVVLVGPGESRSVDITFPEDASTYTTIACLIPGHHEAGMVGELTYSD